MRSVFRLGTLFILIVFISGFPLTAPFYIKIAAVISLFLGIVMAVTSVVGAEVKLDEDKISLRIPFRIGSKEIYWNEITSIDVFYVSPFVANMAVTIYRNDKYKKEHIPVSNFPPEMVRDIISRLSKDVEIDLTPEVRENFDV